MKEIKLWKVDLDNEGPHSVSEVRSVAQTETENQLEDILVRLPDLLLKDLRLVGRQTETAGGPLDLLGVDGDGRLVVFELKRGTLTRAAVAQIIDYASYLAEMDIEALSVHIAEHSGQLGIEKIDNFINWYQEQFGRSPSQLHNPRMILVGLGVDDRARRMVSYLAKGEIDISLVTFYGFEEDGKKYLARHVEVEAKTPPTSNAVTKQDNLKRLQQRVKQIGVDDFYFDIATFFRNELTSAAAYEWPNVGGYSYYLPEMTDTGSTSNRVYISLYLSENRSKGKIQIVLQPRAIEAAGSSIDQFRDYLGQRVHNLQNGSIEIRANSSDDWRKISDQFKMLCQAMVEGWKKQRERGIEEERASATIIEALADKENKKLGV